MVRKGFMIADFTPTRGIEVFFRSESGDKEFELYRDGIEDIYYGMLIFMNGEDHIFEIPSLYCRDRNMRMKTYDRLGAKSIDLSNFMSIEKVGHPICTTRMTKHKDTFKDQSISYSVSMSLVCELNMETN